MQQFCSFIKLKSILQTFCLHSETQPCICTLLCLTLCDLTECSPPSSSVHGIFQVRILEWISISQLRGSFWPRDWTYISWVSCIAVRFFTTAPPGKPHIWLSWPSFSSSWFPFAWRNFLALIQWSSCHHAWIALCPLEVKSKCFFINENALITSTRCLYKQYKQTQVFCSDKCIRGSAAKEIECREQISLLPVPGGNRAKDTRLSLWIVKVLPVCGDVHRQAMSWTCTSIVLDENLAPGQIANSRVHCWG